MKVVLFCGGLGTRIRSTTDPVPKPLVNIGSRPILWHLMRYYAHHGHTDFVLCLGYQGQAIKKFFLDYDECLSSDFVMSRDGNEVQRSGSDVPDWRITFVDTGLHASIGERLRAVRPWLDGEAMFFANYSDALTDLPLNSYLDHARSSGAVASLLAVLPPQSFHAISADPAGRVTGMTSLATSGVRLNGGFFVFGAGIFDYLHAGEDLVEEPFARLIEARQLFAYPYDGFWMPMDTFKDSIHLNRRYSAGDAPWELWRSR